MNTGCISGTSFDQHLLFHTMLLAGYYFHHTDRETGAQRGSQAAQSLPARELDGDLDLQCSHPGTARRWCSRRLGLPQGQFEDR